MGCNALCSVVTRHVYFEYHVKHGTLNLCDHGLWDYEIWDHGNLGPYDYMNKGKPLAFEKTLLASLLFFAIILNNVIKRQN